MSQPIYEYQPKLERPATRPIYSYAWQKIELIKLPTDRDGGQNKMEKRGKTSVDEGETVALGRQPVLAEAPLG